MMGFLPLLVFGVGMGGAGAAVVETHGRLEYTLPKSLMEYTLPESLLEGTLPDSLFEHTVDAP